MNRIGFTLLFLGTFLFLSTSCQNFFWSHRCCDADTASTVYGYVYNWWAAIGDTDGDGITDKQITSSDSWRVPIYSDWQTLADHVDPDWTYVSNTIGSQLKTVGFDYWLDSGDSLDYGTDTDGFSARGTGERSIVTGDYINAKATLYLWRQEESTTTTNGMVVQFSSTEYRLVMPSNATTGRTIDKNAGVSIRLVKNSTTLNDGETGVYVGNNGKAYPTICIGTQEWIQVNLEETEWRDGTAIPQTGWDAAGNAEWIAATSAAMSIP